MQEIKIKHSIKTLLYILFSFFLVICNNSYGQRKIVDSLLIRLHKAEQLNDSARNEILVDLAFAYLTVNVDSSLYFSSELLKNANKKNHWLYLGNYYKGHGYRGKRNLEKALESYLTSAQYVGNSNKRAEDSVSVYIALGDTYSDAKNHNTSMYYYNKAIANVRKSIDSLKLGKILINAGGEYINVDEVDSALLYFKEAEMIFGEINYKSGLGTSLSCIGVALGRKGQYKDAEIKLLKAIEISEKQGNIAAYSHFHINLARIYRKSNQLQKAKLYAENGGTYAKKHGNRALFMYSCEELYEVFKQERDYKNALFYRNQYILYKDSINSQETIRKMADLQTEFEVSKKQVEVDKAQTQLELVEKEKQNQQIVGLGLILILFLTSTLAYIVFRNSKREKETNNVLREQKEELLSQKEELEAQKEELQTQRDIMEEINNTKDRLFSIISHDLRTPVGVLHWGTTLIKDALESKDYDKLWNFTGNMEKSVKNVQVLLDNLLEWAITQRGQYTLHPEETDLSECIDETVAFYTELAQSKEITLTHSPPPGKSFLTIDRNSLSTIVRNLLSNALKFTGNGGFVHILTERKRDSVTISIEDSGVGIPREKLKAIFSMKTKKSSRGTGQEKGLGIGLNLVYEFVKMNNGEIEVESTVGTGTIFTVRFPLHSAMSC